VKAALVDPFGVLVSRMMLMGSSASLPLLLAGGLNAEDQVVVKVI